MVNFSECYLGIELGSTRIKAVVIDKSSKPIASGGFSWQNSFENGHWTYPEELFFTGIRECYKSLLKDISSKFNTTPTTFKAIGVSAMMHGYIALDENFEMLVPFRTWRDTTTGDAAEELTALFSENVPLRWSISHLYQAILNGEEHLKNLSHFTTLAGYIHFMLTGENVLGVCDASGMFPVKNKQYDQNLIDKFDSLIKQKGYSFSLNSLLPKLLLAGEKAGVLTESGARLLDESGVLKAGIPFCAPEGDAATGMVAVNAVALNEGSISAGTSAFAMIVANEKPKKLNRDLDVVCTPNGNDVVMIHQNNCSGEIDAWVGLFTEFASLIGADIPTYKIYDLLYENTETADDDLGVVSYNFISAEPILKVDSPCPSVFRTNQQLKLANFFKSQLYSTVAPLSKGVSDFEKEENIKVKQFKASGGIFKTERVAQEIYANALNTPVTLTQTAGEGGAWGMAVLAQYLDNCEKPLDKWLDTEVFKDSKTVSISPNEKNRAQFEAFMKIYLSTMKEKNICSNS